MLTSPSPSAGGAPGPIPAFSPRERRVLGVLIEKQKTTPEYYPMTVAAVVTACNQKSARDPVVTYDADMAEETLEGLRRKGATVLVEGQGRTVKWKHALYEKLDLKNKPNDLAVLAELLLRGAQTEGDLRARASRMMNPVPDLAGLQAVLEALIARKLVVQLSPPGQRRGVVVAHTLYPADEFERVRQAVAVAPTYDDIEERPARVAARAESAGLGAEVASLKAEVEGLKNSLHALTAVVQELKAQLGV